jgi:hypothetical protein
LDGLGWPSVERRPFGLWLLLQPHYFFHQNLFDFTKLTRNTVVDLYRLALAAPPRAGFAGFPDWGPGNHGDVETNKREHFFKHVLDADPEAVDWKDETRVWWQTLNVAFTRRIARDNMHGPQFNLVAPSYRRTTTQCYLEPTSSLF